MASIAAITGGSVSLAMSLLAFVMLSPVTRKWMYHVYQPVTILSFAVIFSCGLYLIYAGNTGASLLQDYCGKTFERWTKLKYGQYVVALDNTYVEMESTFLCSKKCPCAKIMFDELWIGPYWNASQTSQLQIVNSTGIRNQIISEYRRKYFNGTATSVFACDD